MPRVPVYSGGNVERLARPVAAIAPVRLAQGVGEAIANVGGQVQRAAQTVEEVHQLEARNTAKAAGLDLNNFGSGVLFDPDNGYLAKGGQAAKDGYEPTFKVLSDHVTALADGIKDPRARSAFKQSAGFQLEDWKRQMSVHAIGAFHHASDDTSKGRIGSFSDTAVKSYLDPQASEAALQTALEEVQQSGRQPWNGLSDEQIGNRMFDLRSAVRLGVVKRWTLDADPDRGRAYLDKYRHQLSVVDEDAAESLIRVETARRDAAARRAAAEQRAQEAHARAVAVDSLGARKADLEAGAGTSADWVEVAEGYAAVGDKSNAEAARIKAGTAKAAESYRGAGLAEMDSRIGALTGKRSRTPAEAAELNGLQDLRSATATRLAKPGGALAQYEFASGQTLPPIDLNNPSTFTQRATAARAAARTYGRNTVEPLRENEIPGLKDLVQGDSATRLKAVQLIARFQDPAAIAGAARQVTGEDDGAFRVAVTLSTLPGNAGRDAVRDILRGPEASKTAPAGLFLPAEARRLFSLTAAPALRGMGPDYSDDVMSAAQQLYTSRMAAAGKTVWSAAAWRGAVNAALGGYVADGKSYGGVAYFRDNPVVIPPGWTGDGLFRRLARANLAQWKGAYVSGSPSWPDSSPVYVEQIRELTPARITGTRYGFLTRNGRFLGAKGGGPFIVDVAKVPWQ